MILLKYANEMHKTIIHLRIRLKNEPRNFNDSTYYKLFEHLFIGIFYILWLVWKIIVNSFYEFEFYNNAFQNLMRVHFNYFVLHNII